MVSVTQRFSDLKVQRQAGLINSKGSSCRLRDSGQSNLASVTLGAVENHNNGLAHFSASVVAQFSKCVDTVVGIATRAWGFSETAERMLRPNRQQHRSIRLFNLMLDRSPLFVTSRPHCSRRTDTRKEEC